MMGRDLRMSLSCYAGSDVMATLCVGSFSSPLEILEHPEKTGEKLIRALNRYYNLLKTIFVHHLFGKTP